MFTFYTHIARRMRDGCSCDLFGISKRAREWIFIGGKNTTKTNPKSKGFVLIQKYIYILSNLRCFVSYGKDLKEIMHMTFLGVFSRADSPVQTSYLHLALKVTLPRLCKHYIYA